MRESPETARPPEGREADATTKTLNRFPGYPEPLTDGEIRELGFEPGRRGWRPFRPSLVEIIDAASTKVGLGTYTTMIPFRIPGDAECVVCAERAEASSVATPTCSEICVAVLMETLEPEDHYTRADGSGGSPAVRPPDPPKPKLRPIPEGRPSVERALANLVDCRTVLERHGVDVRWGRVARCPLHDDEHPSMSLYERRGRSRAHCFPCDFNGDAIDLEAAIAGEDVATTIRRWGGN